jgi:hypothetical protein
MSRQPANSPSKTIVGRPKKKRGRSRNHGFRSVKHTTRARVERPWQVRMTSSGGASIFTQKYIKAGTLLFKVCVYMCVCDAVCMCMCVW